MCRAVCKHIITPSLKISSFRRLLLVLPCLPSVFHANFPVAHVLACLLAGKTAVSPCLKTQSFTILQFALRRRW